MQPFTLIIFGITGNLSQIKLIPVLYDMEEQGLLPKGMTIIGSARGEKSKSEFEQYIKSVLAIKSKLNPQIFQRLIKRMYYINGHLEDLNFYNSLNTLLTKLSKKGLNTDNRIYYLSIYPELFSLVFENLHKARLSKTKGFSRLMIEKPLGTDLKSAKALNKLLHQYFKEDQIYRLDHYLGKETIQNILNFRFGNELFEPLMNNNYIDHIQVSVLEDFGIGKRAGFYENTGALKDVGQNHLLQMLIFATMDSPSEFNNAAITKERVKVLKSLIPNPKALVLGQYESYKKEENTSPTSQTNTFFAFKTELNNPRFQGIPIYVRAGKMLKTSVAEISIVFKKPNNRLFKHLDGSDRPNVLIYRIQPNEGIILTIQTKKPGHIYELEDSYFQYCYPLKDNSNSLPNPYQKLLIDAINGDPTFFNDAEEIEAQWSFIDKLKAEGKKPAIYKDGSWGPTKADQLIEKDGRKWLVPSLDFCRI